jgi:hypothetical protein
MNEDSFYNLERRSPQRDGRALDQTINGSAGTVDRLEKWDEPKKQRGKQVKREFRLGI